MASFLLSFHCALAHVHRIERPTLPTIASSPRTAQRRRDASVLLRRPPEREERRSPPAEGGDIFDRNSNRREPPSRRHRRRRTNPKRSHARGEEAMILDPALLDAPELRERRVARSERRDEQRHLGSNDNYVSLLVDKRGNAYEPYSLAWRYLGLHMNCDVEDSEGDWSDYDGDDYGVNRGRRLFDGGPRREPPNRRWPGGPDLLQRELLGGGRRERRLSGSGDGGECARQLLWAAYVDPRYKGVDGIEEYSFYDLETREWDDTACQASGKSHRCVRMDCHEPHTHFKLVGVFKETDGNYDFYEQLFKHEGYCVWSDNDGGGSGSGDGGDGSTYETMETWMEKWPSGCQQLNNPDYYGNTIYLDVHPMAEGNMTLGIFTDEACTQISPYIDLYGYIIELYAAYYYYYGQDRGTEVAEYYSQGVENWNEYMSTFKVCQPCRAYNLHSNQNGNNDDHRHRFLGGDENDGEGDETSRFNCYDDAGYTNVDQCYKFETHTTMEAADSEDLARASAQGSILRVKASDGKVYGKGGYTSPMAQSQLVMYVVLGALAFIGVTMLIFGVLRRIERRGRQRASRGLKETLTGGKDGGNGPDDDERTARSLEMPSVFKSLTVRKITSAFGAPKPSSGGEDRDSFQERIQEAQDEKENIDGVFESLSAVQMRLAGKASDVKRHEEGSVCTTPADEKSPRASYAPPQMTAARENSNPTKSTSGVLLDEKNLEIIVDRSVEKGHCGSECTAPADEKSPRASYAPPQETGARDDSNPMKPTSGALLVETNSEIIVDQSVEKGQCGSECTAPADEESPLASYAPPQETGAMDDSNPMKPTSGALMDEKNSESIVDRSVEKGHCGSECTAPADEKSPRASYAPPQEIDARDDSNPKKPTSGALLDETNSEIIVDRSVEKGHCLRMPSGRIICYNQGSADAGSQNVAQDPPGRDDVANVAQDPPGRDDVAVEKEGVRTALSIETEKGGVEKDAAVTPPTDVCAYEVPGVATETSFIGDIMSDDARPVGKDEFC